MDERKCLSSGVKILKSPTKLAKKWQFFLTPPNFLMRLPPTKISTVLRPRSIQDHFDIKISTGGHLDHLHFFRPTPDSENTDQGKNADWSNYSFSKQWRKWMRACRRKKAPLFLVVNLEIHLDNIINYINVFCSCFTTINYVLIAVVLPWSADSLPSSLLIERHAVIDRQMKKHGWCFCSIYFNK